MFGIGVPEMILILAVALIVVGPNKLPELAKSIGRAMGEFKKATNDLKNSMKIDKEIKNVGMSPNNNFSMHYNDEKKQTSKEFKNESITNDKNINKNK